MRGIWGQIHTKESLHIIHVFPTFGTKFGPLELPQNPDIQYTITRDPYLWSFKGLPQL